MSGSNVSSPLRSGAVAWVEPSRALVASTTPGGSIILEEVVAETPGAPYIARVIDEIGDVDRVIILGPSEERLIVEREYLLVYRDPERIVDVAHAEHCDREELLARLHRITHG